MVVLSDGLEIGWCCGSSKMKTFHGPIILKAFTVGFISRDRS